jgi:hypothetical protein
MFGEIPRDAEGAARTGRNSHRPRGSVEKFPGQKPCPNPGMPELAELGGVGRHAAIRLELGRLPDRAYGECGRPDLALRVAASCI